MGTGARRRKRVHKNDKHIKKKYRTKRRTKDLDQILEDLLNPTTPHREFDVPGSGEHCCITCSRHFIDGNALQKHFNSKPHKRRLHRLGEPRYTQREAETAAGQGSYRLPS